MRKEDKFKELILQERIKLAVAKQAQLRDYEKVFIQLINDSLAGEVKVYMSTHTNYKIAYNVSDLVDLWKELKDYCLAGATGNITNKLKLSFYKVAQAENQSYEDYVAEFESRLNHLNEHQVTIATNELRDVFIAGLDEERYGEVRSRMELRKEQMDSMGQVDLEYPSTWLMAKDKFKSIHKIIAGKKTSETKPVMSALTASKSPQFDISSLVAEEVKKVFAAMSLEQDLMGEEVKPFNSNMKPHTLPNKGNKISKKDASFIKQDDKKYHGPGNKKKEEPEPKDQLYMNMQKEWVPIPLDIPVSQIGADGVVRNLSHYVRQKMAQGKEKRELLTSLARGQKNSVRNTQAHMIALNEFSLSDNDNDEDVTDETGNVITTEIYLPRKIYINQKARSQNDDCLIFDPGATDNVVTNIHLLTNIKTIKMSRIEGVGGDTFITQEGTLGIYGPALLCNIGNFNLLSHHAIRKMGFKVAYDDDLNEYSIYKDGRLINTFRANNNGLYVTPIINLKGVIPNHCPREKNEIISKEDNISVDRSNKIRLGEKIIQSTIRSKSKLSALQNNYKLVKSKQINMSVQISKREEILIDEADRLHTVLGHPGDIALCKLLDNGGILNCPVTSDHVRLLRKHRGKCPICERAKAMVSNQDSIKIAKHYPTNDKEEILYTDIFYLKGDKKKVPYLVTVLAKSKHMTVTNLKRKTAKHIANTIIYYVKKYKSKYGIRVLKVISDHEANFTATEDMLEEIGSVLIQNPPESHSRAAERAIRSLKQTARAIYLSLPYTLPCYLYDQLLIYTVEKLNLTPTSSGDGRCPREIIGGNKVDYKKDFKASFGQVCWFPVPRFLRKNDLEERAELGIVVGNSPGKEGVCKAYIFSRHVICQRSRFHPGLLDETIKKVISQNLDKDLSFCDEETSTDDMRFLDDLTTYKTDVSYEPNYWSNPSDLNKMIQRKNSKIGSEDQVNLVTDNTIPTTHKVIPNTKINIEDEPYWDETPLPDHTIFRTVCSKRNVDGSLPEGAKQSIKGEFINLLEYDTWDPILPNAKISAKWVQSLMIALEKFKADGSFEKWKGRLAVMGNQITEQLEENVSSPTMDMASLFLLIILANHLGVDMESLDVPSAYLNAPLKESVYMLIAKESSDILVSVDQKYEQYRRKDGSILVRLKKSLYGLRQSGVNWYNEVKTHLDSNGFKSLTTDPCIFVKHDSNNKNLICVVGLYVDDIFFFGNSDDLVNKFKEGMISKHKIKKFYKNNISYLGLRIINNKETGLTTVDQEFYIQSMLKKYNVMVNGKDKPVDSPSDEDLFKETNSSTTGVNQNLYRSIVMSLLYVAKRTRPDILLGVTYLSRKCMKATTGDWKKLQRILLYLAWHPSLKIYIHEQNSDEMKFEIHCDASHLTHDDCRGHTGLILLLNKNFVVASSKKQSLNADSSCESELIALHSAGQLSSWLINILEELDIVPINPVIIYQDNQSTIKVANQGHGKFGRTKHIKRRFFGIKGLVDEGLVKLEYLPTNDMIADLLTKPLSVYRRNKLRAVMMGDNLLASAEIIKCINWLRRHAGR